VEAYSDPEGWSDSYTDADGNTLQKNLVTGEIKQVTKAKKGEESSEAKATQKIFKNEEILRKEFTKQSTDFVKVRDSYKRVIAASKDPSAAGDLALIFNYMKILDPGSVVRESEFANAAATGSYGERLKAAAAKFLAGERLSDEMREDFVNRARKLYDEQLGSHRQLISEYTNLASKNKLDPSNIIIDYIIQTQPEELKNSTLPDEAKAKLKEGKITEFKNGQSWTLKNGKAWRIK
jgi:hypothetical protein